MPSTLDVNGGIAIPRRSTEGGHSVSTLASNISLIPTDLNELDNDLKGRDLSEQVYSRALLLVLYLHLILPFFLTLQLEYLNGLLQKATRIRNGAENLLEASQPRVSSLMI